MCDAPRQNIVNPEYLASMSSGRLDTVLAVAGWRRDELPARFAIASWSRAIVDGDENISERLERISADGNSDTREDTFFHEIGHESGYRVTYLDEVAVAPILITLNPL